MRWYNAFIGAHYGANVKNRNVTVLSICKTYKCSYVLQFYRLSESGNWKLNYSQEHGNGCIGAKETTGRNGTGEENYYGLRFRNVNKRQNQPVQGITAQK